MAEDINESWLDVEDVEENKVVLLQSHIRGYLTRKWMQALQHEFEEMCLNIELKPIEIEWPRNHLCSPKILNPKQRKTKSSGKEKDFKDNETVKPLKQETTSVEIQTENCDYLNETNLKRHNNDFGSNSDATKKNLRMNDHSSHVVDKREVTLKTESAVTEATVVQRFNENPEKFIGTGTVQDPILVGDTSPTNNFNSQRNFVPISSPCDRYSNNISDKNVVAERDIPKDSHTLNTGQVPGVRNNKGVILNVDRPDISSVADTSSVWDADISSVQGHTDKLPTEKKELTELRKNLAMELLWIQQAITSRKNYLKLKGQMV